MALKQTKTRNALYESFAWDPPQFIPGFSLRCLPRDSTFFKFQLRSLDTCCLKQSAQNVQFRFMGLIKYNFQSLFIYSKIILVVHVFLILLIYLIFSIIIIITDIKDQKKNQL